MSKWSFSNEPKYITHSATSRTSGKLTKTVGAAVSVEASRSMHVDAAEESNEHAFAQENYREPAPQHGPGPESDGSFHYVGTIPDDQRFGVDQALPQQGMSGQGSRTYALAPGQKLSADHVPFANSTRRNSENTLGSVLFILVAIIILVIAGAVFVGVANESDPFDSTWNNVPGSFGVNDFPEGFDPSSNNWSVDLDGNLVFDDQQLPENFIDGESLSTDPFEGESFEGSLN